MNRYAKVLSASAHAYTAQASTTAKWTQGRTMSSWIEMQKQGPGVPWLIALATRQARRAR
jgi:hypothetical protein